MLEIVTRAVALSLLLTVTVWIESLTLQRFAGSWVVAGSQWVGLASPPARDRTAVVLYDDDPPDEQLAEAWPLPYAAWGRVAVGAWCSGASSLMFDFGFSRNARDPGPDGERSALGFATLLNALSADSADNDAARLRASLFARCAGHNWHRQAPTPMAVFIAPPSDTVLRAAARDLIVDVSQRRDGIYHRLGPDGILSAAFAVAYGVCAARPAGAAGCAGPLERTGDIVPQDGWTTPADQKYFSASYNSSGAPPAPPVLMRMRLECTRFLRWTGRRRAGPRARPY